MPDFDALIAKRTAAAERGDFGLVREITIYLERNGYIESAVLESVEQAVAPRPRGRPRKTAV